MFATFRINHSITLLSCFACSKTWVDVLYADVTMKQLDAWTNLLALNYCTKSLLKLISFIFKLYFNKCNYYKTSNLITINTRLRGLLHTNVCICNSGWAVWEVYIDGIYIL